MRNSPDQLGAQGVAIKVEMIEDDLSRLAEPGPISLAFEVSRFSYQPPDDGQGNE
jgi:hypothetical protein